MITKLRQLGITNQIIGDLELSKLGADLMSIGIQTRSWILIEHRFQLKSDYFFLISQLNDQNISNLIRNGQ